MTTLVIMLFCTVCVYAQSSNKYVVKLKNGIDVECVSYKLTADNNIEVTYADGSTVSIKMDDVEKISQLETKKETATQRTQQNVQPVQQPSAYQQPPTYQQTQQQVVYGNQDQVMYAKPAKSPALAGVLSFLIPGVGQFYNGHVGAGIGFLVGYMVLGGLSFSTVDGMLYLNLIPFAGALALDIWSIVHAVKGAKRVNAERGYALGNGQYLDVQPTILAAPAYAQNTKYGNAYGVSFGLRF